MGYYLNSITLSIEDSIVISGSNVANKANDNYSALIYLNSRTSTFVMRQGSTLTSFNCAVPSQFSGVVLLFSNRYEAVGKFVMTGGTITGNTFTPTSGGGLSDSKALIVSAYAIVGTVQKSGGSISGNDRNFITFSNSAVYDMDNLEAPLEEDKIYLALPTTP
jgi:hypothetical protein